MMRITITNYGHLLIGDKKKYCPHGKRKDTIEMAQCGDWCVLFGEPWIRKATQSRKSTVHVHICQMAWTCSEENFTDERKEKEEPNDQVP